MSENVFVLLLLETVNLKIDSLFSSFKLEAIMMHIASIPLILKLLEARSFAFWNFMLGLL